MARVKLLVGITALVAAAAAAGVYASSGPPPLHGGTVSRGATVAVQLEVFGWLLGLAGLAWASRRHRLVGPVAPGLPPRILRVVAALLSLAFVVLTVDGLHSQPGGDEASRAVWLAICIVITIICAVAFLAVSSRAAAMDAAALAVGTGIGVAAALGWFAVMLSHPTLPGHNNGAVATVLVVTALAALWAIVRTGRTDHGLQVGYVAGTTSSLLLFLVTMATFRLDGQRVPHSATPFVIANSTPAQRLAEDRIGASDFYVAVLLLGALLAVALIWAIVVAKTREPRAPRERSREPLVLQG